MNCECVKSTVTALMAMLSVGVVANPLGVQTYEQTLKVKFADAEAAKRAECVMTRLPGDAKAMLSARWDDSSPNHVAKVKMLKSVGVKSTIYANQKVDFLTGDAKKIIGLGNAIGNHTSTHPFMMEISANRDFSEILLNRINIETNLDASCVSFAAPFGWCAAIDAAKPVLVSDILFNTGHYVSGDNVIPETKGGEKKRYPTRLVRSGDSKIEPEKVAQSFKSALAWIAANPQFPRMSYGVHSWCDDAGNALQAQTIRDAWQDDWCTGTDAEYGAYSYQHDYGKIEKLSTNGDVVEFKVTRFDPRPLGSLIPMSLKFSEMPKKTSLEAGLRGTYLLPHDSSRKIVTKIGSPLSERFPKISVKLKLQGDDQLLVGLRNDSDSRLDDIYGVVMLPPKWKNGRVVFAFPPLESGADINLTPILLEPADRKDYAYGPADYACSIDFYQNGEACRLWALTSDEGVKPPAQLTPSETVRSVGVFDSAKLVEEDCRAMSVADAELKNVGTAVNEKWSATGKVGGSGFTVHFWPDFMQHSKSRLDYRDAVAKLIDAGRQARLFAYDFVSDYDGEAKLYASTDRGLPKVTPIAWVNGEQVKLARKVVNAIKVKKGVNRVILRLDMVQTRWPESALLVVCRDGLDTPFPAYRPATNWPLVSLRIAEQVDVPRERIAPFFMTLGEFRGAFDDIWFCIGSRYPDYATALADSEQARVNLLPLCKAAGIDFSVQQGLTLGHESVADWPRPGARKVADDGWSVDRQGVRLAGIFCPRSPDALSFVYDTVKATVEKTHPRVYWLDDDLRLGISKPAACFCERCLKDFNAKHRTAFTRETLTARLFDEKVPWDPVRKQWSDFNAQSLAIYGASARKAIDDLGAETILAYQAVWSDTIYTGRDYKSLLDALSANGKHPTAIRPGAGWYREGESGVHGVVAKCLSVAREAERCRDYGPMVGSVSYENETYPRMFLSKSPSVQVAECALAMASGCDAVSVYGYCGEDFVETNEFARLYRHFATARPYFERMREEVRRTRLGGVARYIGSHAAERMDFDLRDEADQILAQMGVPVTCAEAKQGAYYITKKSVAESDVDEIAAVRAKGAYEFDLEGGFRWTPSAAKRKEILDKLDRLVPGGMPVRLVESRMIRVLPRIDERGHTSSVTLFNMSLGATDGLKLRVRRPAGAADGVSVMTPDHSAVEFSVKRDGDELVILINNIIAGGVITLFFG